MVLQFAHARIRILENELQTSILELKPDSLVKTACPYDFWASRKSGWNKNQLKDNRSPNDCWPFRVMYQFSYSTMSDDIVDDDDDNDDDDDDDDDDDNDDTISS